MPEAIAELQEAARLEPEQRRSSLPARPGAGAGGTKEEAAAELQKGRELVAADDRSQNANLDIAEGRAALERATRRRRPPSSVVRSSSGPSRPKRNALPGETDQHQAAADDPRRVAELEKVHSRG